MHNFGSMCGLLVRHCCSLLSLDKFYQNKILKHLKVLKKFFMDSVGSVKISNAPAENGKAFQWLASFSIKTGSHLYHFGLYLKEVYLWTFGVCGRVGVPVGYECASGQKCNVLVTWTSLKCQLFSEADSLMVLHTAKSGRLIHCKFWVYYI